MAGPVISGAAAWKQYEQRLLELFARALGLLRAKALADDAVEDDINRQLCLCLKSANFVLSKEGRGLESPPFFNAPTQPDHRDGEKTPQELKRPDFQHQLVDIQALTVEEAYRCYHVECKRLGAPPSKGRELARDYVDDGVRRFQDSTHRYGHRCCSGAMVGYVQSLDLGEILSKVNAANECRGCSEIALSSAGWRASGVSQLNQSFERPFPISPFDLRHLWVDMRPVSP